MSVAASRSPIRPAGDILVIGYGNPLRRDDGLGPHLAAEVASWRLPHVHVVIAHQLGPEMADDLSRARAVVFLDAKRPKGTTVAISRILPAHHASSLSHAVTPEVLLALSQAIYGRAPHAVSVCVAGETFEAGEGLSAAARRRAALAARRLRTVLQRMDPLQERQ